MKSICFRQAFMLLVISGSLAACAGNDNTDTAGARAPSGGNSATQAPPPDSEALAEINAPVTAPAPTATTGSTAGMSTAGTADSTAMDEMDGSMAGTAADGTVVGNAASSSGMETRCEGLAGQALTDCTNAQSTETRTSDNAPATPPAQ